LIKTDDDRVLIGLINEQDQFYLGS